MGKLDRGVYRYRGIAACAVLWAVVLPSQPVLAWNSAMHGDVSIRLLLATKGSELYNYYSPLNGRCPEIRDMKGAASITSDSAMPHISFTCQYVDNWQDLEWVDVEGIIGDTMDDPHQDESWTIDDEAGCVREGSPLTSFSHFIDIRKGPGIFDDYDGYSYEKGSAKFEQHQTAEEAAPGGFAKWMAAITGYKVDEGVMWWFNDEYVHAPGHKWYRGCSPALERYSFFGDKGKYQSVEQECWQRFTLAQSTGGKDRGIPYSVFMPVDNMARYWYGRFVQTRDPQCMGAVFHAIQDASVLHHAAGCLGNWHGWYEERLEKVAAYNGTGWTYEPDFMKNAIDLAKTWTRQDPSPPAGLQPDDFNKTPALNWKIDQLVTWVALNANREYCVTYNYFRGGKTYNDPSARTLTTKALAMCLLVLHKGMLDNGYKPVSKNVYEIDPLAPSSAHVRAPAAPDSVHVKAPPAPDPPRIVKTKEPATLKPQETIQTKDVLVTRKTDKVEPVQEPQEGKMQTFPVEITKTLTSGGISVVEFDSDKAEVKVADGQFWVVSGDVRIYRLGDEPSAGLAVNAIKQLKLNKRCWISSGGNPVMEYYLSNNQAPVGPFDGGSTRVFEPAELELKQINGVWHIVRGRTVLTDAGTDQNVAQKVLDTIRNYGFTHMCVIGQNEPVMTVFYKL